MMHEHSSATERQQLRRLLLSYRGQLTEAERERAAHKVSEHLHALTEFQQAQTIGSYHSVRAELPTAELNQHLQREKQLALPRLHPVVSNHLLFLQVTEKTIWHANSFGIPEPRLASPDIVPLDHLDILLVPLVGFDQQGNRMGMGGGFYDRTLAAHRAGRYPKLLTIGLAFDCQQLEQLPTEPWDVPLNMVITPAKIWDFRS